MNRLHARIEKATGLLFGTYRWTAPKPSPKFAVTLRRPVESDMVRLEVVWGGRGFYATPKSQHSKQRAPAPRLNAEWRYRPLPGDTVSVTVTGVITDYDATVGHFHVRGTVPGMTHIAWEWPFHWATEFTLVRHREERTW